jgi:hypothetical protein
MHRRSAMSLIVAVFTALLLAVLSAPVGAAPGGNGPGGGGGGGGGGGSGPGGGGPGGGGPGGGGGKGGVYSELVVLYRDVKGLPIMAELGGELCVQPVSYVPIDNIDPLTNPVNGATVWLVPLVGELPAATSEDGEVEVCDPQPEYAAYVAEVQLERLNQGRSPSKVVERQLAEVQAMVTGVELSLEASGRLVAGGVTIDSPLMNTAIYLSLMIDGVLLDSNGIPVTLPTPPTPYSYDTAHHAAVALAMAAGKEVPMNVDTFVYQNRVLDVPDRTTAFQTVGGGTTCTLPTGYTLEDRFTTCGLIGEKYVDYTGFTYDRAQTFSGCVTYLDWNNAYQATTQPIMDVVFGNEPASADNVAGVALHGDDARRVNLWFHDYGLLIGDWDAPGETGTCSAQ